MRDPRELEERIAALEQEVARLRAHQRHGVRRRAAFTIFGLPAYDIALGPDPEKGEPRGHARGFIAVGDVATGVLALGGVARGLIALGGLAIGGLSLGGLSVGLGIAFGGLAIGSLALGGGALGGVAVGGGAVGYYAAGADATGKYVLSPRRQDPEAAQLFREYGLPLPEGERRRQRR